MLTMFGGGDTQTLLDVKLFFELYAFPGAKTLSFPSSQALSLALALVPHMSYLVRLSLPNI